MKNPEFPDTPKEKPPKTVEGQKESILLYHGTKNDVDSFSTEKIGSGHGGQTYGYGLYFTRELGMAEANRRGGHMYEIELMIKPEEILDLDAPLSSAPMKSILDLEIGPSVFSMNSLPETWTGEDLQNKLSKALFGSQKMAAEYLQKAGVRALTYANGSCFVVLDDSRIKILRKNGIPVTDSKNIKPEI